MNIEKIIKTTKSDGLIERFKRWGISNSLLPLMYGSSCCFGPMSREQSFETGLYGDYSVEDSDLLIIGGSITYKQLPFLKDIYSRMEKKKWVMALGVCAFSGGPFQTYSVVSNLSEHIPIDIFVPGCPPSKESFEDGVFRLRKMIQAGKGSHFEQ